MNIDNQIKNWAKLVLESECGFEHVNESLDGEFTNGEMAKSFEDMLKSRRRSLIRALYMNDSAFVSIDYSVGDKSVDFKAADSVINDKTLKLEEMIRVLNDNSDKFSTFDGKRITLIDYDIEDTYGETLPIGATSDADKKINEVSDVDVDQETWKDDMGRADDRFYDEYLKKVNDQHVELVNKIQKMSSQQFSPVFIFLIDMIEQSFDSEPEFSNMLKEKFQNRFRNYKFSGIQKEIVDTIAKTIKENHYQSVEKDVNRELD